MQHLSEMPPDPVQHLTGGASEKGGSTMLKETLIAVSVIR